MQTINLSGLTIEEAARVIFPINPDLAENMETLEQVNDDLTAELEIANERADTAEDRIEKVSGRLTDIFADAETIAESETLKEFRKGMESLIQMIDDLRSSIDGE